MSTPDLPTVVPKRPWYTKGWAQLLVGLVIALTVITVVVVTIVGTMYGDHLEESRDRVPYQPQQVVPSQYADDEIIYADGPAINHFIVTSNELYPDLAISADDVSKAAEDRTVVDHKGEVERPMASSPNG